MKRRKSKRASSAKAQRRFKRFWGVDVQDVLNFDDGRRGKKTLVGMGISPGVYLTDGPEGRARKKWTVKGRRWVATDAGGRRIFILSRKGARKFGKKPRFVGYARETRYIPYGSVERAGSPKSNRVWVHSHGSDEKGKYPKVYKDAGGNYLYAPGTYKVTSWIYH